MEFILRLSKLVDQTCTQDPDILGLSSDSRHVKPGDLFFAIPGLALDGRGFIEEAISKGARAILTTEDNNKDHCSIPIIKVSNIRSKIPEIAAKFYQTPPKSVVMVTGTNGKSSTVSLYQQLLCAKDIKAASIGTLGIQSGLTLPFNDNFYGLTTPDPITLHRLLSQLGHNGFDHVAIEATSIGLDQHRLNHVEIEAAAFTNFNQDHLDYHDTMDKYFEAKTLLFKQLMKPSKLAILNCESERFDSLVSICKERNQSILTYGKNAQADLRLIEIHPHLHGQDLKIIYKNKEYSTTLSLLGECQAYNLLTALGLLIASGFALEDLMPFVPLLKSIPGRLEQIDGAPIFVDYSHKPVALQNAILSLKQHTEGKIIVVFGCGGNRDKGKRPIMGAIAQEFADDVIVTDDNPRFEDAAEIRQEILSTCPKAVEIADRKKAIEEGMTRLRSGDILIVAGKGNETGQIIGNQIIPFNDADIIKEFLGKV